MSSVAVKVCDLCHRRAEVRGSGSMLGYANPDGWITADHKDFCGWECVAAYAETRVIEGRREAAEEAVAARDSAPTERRSA